MSEVLQANIFFLIASVATVIFIIMISLAIYQVIRILMAVRAIVERIAATSDLIAEDVASAREFVRNGGIFSYLVGQFMVARSGFGRATRKRSRRSADKDDIE